MLLGMKMSHQRVTATKQMSKEDPVSMKKPYSHIAMIFKTL